ncbi:S-adenosyl-l-methionine hydroxide adenosyltransferase family protein [Povalibacter sp.]|uniref:SAM hydrolase/SAM-dependent halogenase family protein n=1 Tax=Povalibacter sp. TaxID=1962978 RepID=UPI002F3E34A0
MKALKSLLLILLLLPLTAFAKAPLVFMTDFGVRDGAVSAMKGVAYGISPDLLISDLSHEITGIFDGAYRLYQTEEFWPRSTVFVTVIDPGVGTSRQSVVLRTRNGQYFVGPNNGLYTLVAEREGIDELRLIDEKVNRRPGSAGSYTFHGRDVFAYTAAKLASGQITFEQVGPRLPNSDLISIPYRHAERQGDVITGGIPVLDVAYGNVWSNIPQSMFDELKVRVGEPLNVRIYNGTKLVHEERIPYQHTFGNVPVGQPLIYVNSLMNIAIALNQGNYAVAHGIESGGECWMEIQKSK